MNDDVMDTEALDAGSVGDVPDTADSGAVGSTSAHRAPSDRIDSILKIPVVVQVVVGSASLPVSSLLKLGRGAVIPLDHRVGDPVDVVVNGRTIARGEVVVVEEDGARFGVSLTEICEPRGRDAT